MFSTTAYFTSSAAFHFFFIGAAFIPVFMLINCCFSKKKKKKDVKTIRKLEDLPTTKKKEEVPPKLEPETDDMLRCTSSKTINKIDVIGDEDPDLDSRRLTIMRTQDDDDDPQKEVPVIRCSETVNLAKDVKREATVNKPVQTKPTTKKQMRTKTATAQSTGNRLSNLKQKMRQQKKKTMEPRANSNRPRKLSRPGICVAAAAQHLENQQSMPRLRPPVHHNNDSSSRRHQHQKQIDGTDSQQSQTSLQQDDEDESARV